MASPPEDGPTAGVEPAFASTYDHVRWAFWLSLAIAGGLFVLGAALVAVAARSALGEESLSRGTILVAGLGLAALVLLFVTRPWSEAARQLADAEQVRIVAASYLAGTGLADRHDAEALGLLTQLTATSVALLEHGDEPLPESKLSALQAAAALRHHSSPES